MTFAESTVKQAVWAREMGPTFKWLEKKHPDWSNEQTIEHTGTIGVQAGLMTKAEIAAMSDDDLKRLSVVRKKELDDVQSEIADIENGQHQPT
jgi:hypothetical protein